MPSKNNPSPSKTASLFAKKALPEDTKNMTPMMVQYFSIKESYPDYLLFYRMGDFYELFFEDAVIASQTLNIVLTKRGSHLGQDIPMAGFPEHSYEPYLFKLVEKGFRVAVCEQMESPAQAKKRNVKSIVTRAVVRLVTAGTLTEEHLLDAKTHNYLAALAEHQGKKALSWLDITTGDFYVRALEIDEIPTSLGEINCKELLLPESLLLIPELFECFALWKKILRPLPINRFNVENCKNILCSFFKVTSLEGYGDFTPAQIMAAATLIDYIHITQINHSVHLLIPKIQNGYETMLIDPSTRHHLEITQTQKGKREGSLIHSIDYCLTASGARLLHDRISHPLTAPSSISRRLDSIAFFLKNYPLCEKIRKILKHVPDIERALSRLYIQRGSPRDLAIIRNGLSRSSELKATLSGIPKNSTKLVLDITHALGQHMKLCQTLEDALAENLPAQVHHGGFIAKNYDAQLDKLYEVNQNSQKVILALEGKYRKETQIDRLKIKHNAVLGYFIEASRRHGEKIQKSNAPLTLKQSTAQTIRYSSTELEEKARDIIEAQDKISGLEQEIYHTLVKEVLEKREELTLCSKALAGLDVATSLAVCAQEKNYCRPETNHSTDFFIEKGRHPIIEKSKDFKGDFIANDCNLGAENYLWLVTGPNMAGKSTFLRQNALIAILAQSGCYVPAQSCAIGIIDRLFSRIGASDDLARGQSTFMVEMIEVAAILNQATKKSLVILDEIGRGTATFDGLSIAWAMTEHLHDTLKCRTLFATHYHELTQLKENHPALYPIHFRVREWKNNIIFLYQISSGSADQSYGIHVAKMAGVPENIIERAYALLKSIEAEKKSFDISKKENTEKEPEQKNDTEIIHALKILNPDKLSPRDALDLLYQLKNIAEKS